MESAIIVFVSKGLTPAQTSSAIASCVNSTDTDTDACHSTTANTNYSDNANADTSGSATATYDAYIGTGMSDHDQSGEYDRPISSSVVTREKESDSGEDNGNHESHPSRGMLIPSTANRDREGNGDRDGDIYASRDIKSNIDGSGGSGSDGKFNDRSHDYGTGNNVYDSDSSNSNNNSNSNISRGVGMAGERHQTAAATITVTGTGTGITSLPRPRSSSEDEDGDGDAEEDSIDHDQAVQKGTDRGETHAEKEAQEEDGRAIYHGYTTNHNNMNIEEGTREMEEESGGMGEHKEGRYDNDENESN